MTSNTPRMQLADYSPILTFIISFFIFHLFDWQDATYFAASVLVSLLTYNYEVHLLKEERNINRHAQKKTNFHAGLLLLLFLTIIAASFLHWYKVLAMAWRMGILLTLVVIYTAVLFRAINTLFFIKIQSPKK